MTSKKERPLLSIAIPTKNRYKTLVATLNCMLKSLDDSVEFVIADNSDDNAEFRDDLGSGLISDSRVQYFYDSKQISIVENTEKALSMCTGEFVCFIGDDDFVSPKICHYLRSVVDKNIDAISYPGAYYWWSDVHFLRKSYYDQPGAFWYPSGVFEPITISADDSVRSLLRSGGVSIGTLPRLYHGVVRRSTLEYLKKITGKYVHGASPDMALAVGIALMGVNTHFICTPLTIYGASKNSGGGWTAENKHHGNIKDQTHIPQFTKDNWSKFLPEVWSEQTIYPQTIIEVFASLGKKCCINLNEFYASMFVNEQHLRTILLPFIFSYYKTKKSDLPAFFLCILKKKCGRIKRVLETFFKLRKFHVYHGLKVDEVVELLDHIHDGKYTYDK